MMGVGTVYRLENIDGMILYRTSSHQSTTVRPLCWITWRRCLSTPQFWSTKIPAMIRRTKNVRLRGFIFIFSNFFYRELKMDIFENLNFFFFTSLSKKNLDTFLINLPKVELFVWNFLNWSFFFVGVSQDVLWSSVLAGRQHLFECRTLFRHGTY